MVESLFQLLLVLKLLSSRDIAFVRDEDVFILMSFAYSGTYELKLAELHLLVDADMFQDLLSSGSSESDHIGSCKSYDHCFSLVTTLSDFCCEEKLTCCLELDCL